MNRNDDTVPTTAAAATTVTKRKKQPRNRRLQRYWRKLRRQHVDERTIQKYKKRLNRQRRPQQQQIQDVEMEEIIPCINNTIQETTDESIQKKKLPGPYNPQRKMSKRKLDQSSQPKEATVIKSLSQMSMTEKSTKKKKRSPSSMQLEQQQQQQQHETEDMGENQENTNIQSDTIEQTTTSRSIHYYLNAPKRKFKRMFNTSLVNGSDVVQWCNTDEKLNYVYEHTCLLDRVYYLNLEEDLWRNYLNYGQEYHCWTTGSHLSKTIIRQNQLTFDYQKGSQESTEKYLIKLAQQLTEAKQKLDTHASLLKNFQQQDSIAVDEQRLWAAILALVRKGQHKLCKQYEHQKQVFQNTAIDYQLVKACYDCQPTQEEIRSMQIIWRATKNECKSQEQVDILKQHLYIKRIPQSLNYLDQSFQKIEKQLRKSIYNNNVRTTILSRYKKIIAQNKCDLITLDISMAEAAVRGYHQSSENEKTKLFDRMIKDPHRGQSVANQFKQAIEQRQKHIRQHTQYLIKQRIHFFYHRSDDRRQKKWHRRSYRLNSYWNILPSSPITEVFSRLTSEQLALLARGPKYVPPCQSRFYKKEKRQKLIEQEHQSIMFTITEFIRQGNYCISQKRIDEFSSDHKNLLQCLHTTKLSKKLYVRAKREHKLLMGIRRYLRQNRQVILRRTDKSKVFHLGDANDYEEKVRQYMQETDAYDEITSGISPLSANFQQVTSLLDRLYRTQKLLSKKQYEAMYPKLNETELGHLYFIPKPHKIGTPLRPIVASIHAPAIKISAYLDDLLRPIYYDVAKQTTYINHLHVIQQLEDYQRKGYLLPTTKFITADVKNLYTMIPQGGALDALYRFCTKHSKGGKIGNLTVHTIIQLACTVLETNCFVFGNTYYKQRRGGAMGSPFTMTLANIYMYEWEATLIKHQQERNQLYGRYIDDILFTTNESIDTMKQLLDKEAQKDANIGINYNISESVEFLDTFIENNQGQLRTTVYRKPAAEPYILPYTSDHPRHLHTNTIHTALLRAIRICSDVELFDQERLNIEIALLLNGYPPKFISHHFKRFFRQHNLMSMYRNLKNETYQQFHQHLLDQFLKKDQPLPAPTHEEKQQQQAQQEKNNQTTTKKPKKLIIHYRFEGGPLLKYKQEFRTLWTKHFCYENSSFNNVHLILGIRTNSSLERLLVKKKPSRELLRTMANAIQTTTIAT